MCLLWETLLLYFYMTNKVIFLNLWQKKIPIILLAVLDLLCLLRFGNVVLGWFDKNYGLWEVGSFTDEKQQSMKENKIQVFVGSLKDAKFTIREEDYWVSQALCVTWL